MLYEFIDKVVVHAPTGGMGRYRNQQIDCTSALSGAMWYRKRLFPRKKESLRSMLLMNRRTKISRSVLQRKPRISSLPWRKEPRSIRRLPVNTRLSLRIAVRPGKDTVPNGKQRKKLLPNIRHS